ncbi:hypothetical protein [Clostridium arbusti]|uniref:hypothetical protein n=1 Tax=Clostridium arbusti TaxID=1137848 RepID=UPI000287D40D|nr:hypothetical protein [Clostridium arbusti]
MSRILKHMTVWICISLAVQFGVLYYINKNYLKTETYFQTKKIEVKALKKSEITINIPSDAEQIKASYDGNYISYYQGEVLKVVNTLNGQEKSVVPAEGNKISLYQWLPDRHRIILAEKPTSSYKGNIELKYYDSSKDVKDNIEKLTWSDKQSEIQDIEVSPITNLMFVKVKRNSERNDTYEVNAMNEVNKITTVSNLGNIKILPHEDELIYEDADNHTIETTNKDHSIIFKDVPNPTILGCDNNDNIYIGSVTNGKIDKIYYGSPQDHTDQWQVLNVSEPCDANDIYVSEAGEVYVNSNLKGQIQSLKGNKITSYSGNLLQMTDKVVISNENGKLQKTIYK